MGYMEEYQLWSTDPFFDEGTRNELIAIKDDGKEIEDRFYRDLEFGTAGLRGVLGAGTNRMNVYTVAKASEGLAKYILSEGEDAIKRGVVISYDSRHFSPEFAQITAQEPRDLYVIQSKTGRCGRRQCDANRTGDRSCRRPFIGWGNMPFDG